MSRKAALQIILFMLSALLLFHFLVIGQFIPFDQVWGGRLKSEAEMIRFESFAIAFNLFMLLIYGIKYRQLSKGMEHRFINFLIWVFASFFFLNTLGNLMAVSKVEMIVGSIFTLTVATLSIVVVKREKAKLTK